MKPVSLANMTRHATSTLFLVPSGTDRHVEALRLAAPLVGGTERDHALARRGVHPDIIALCAPEGKERIGIDQVRAAIRAAQFAPVQGDRKVCVIPSAEDLTPEAANALLKTLEEPPREMAFVLLAEQTVDLLPTIVSRSRILRLLPTDTSDLIDRLRQVGYDDLSAEWILEVSDRPGELDRFFTEHVDIAQLRENSRARAESLGAVELVSASIGGESVLRREALVALLERAAARDGDLLIEGVRFLASQPREAGFGLLQDLLHVAFGPLRSDRSRTADPQVWDRLGSLGAGRLEAVCLAIDRAHRALSTHAPPEAVFLSLLLSVGGGDDGR